MAPEDKRTGSAFWAFWSSLPGVLTGIAAVLAAVGTLAALFIGGDDTQSAAPGAIEAEPPAAPGPIEAEPPAPPGAGETEPPVLPRAAADGCFRRYFKGIPGYRLGTVEAGAYEDVLSESEPKAGPIGLTLTDLGQVIGGIRFIFFPENTFFKIESIVDASCRSTEDYESRTGGDKHDWEDSSAVRVRLGGRSYDLTANGAGSIVRVGFVAVAP